MGEAEPPVGVRAVELDHGSVPSVGWVVSERPRAGRLNAMAAKPVLLAHGLHRNLLKQLQRGEAIPLPDGTCMRPEDFVGPTTQRTIAVLPCILDGFQEEVTYIALGGVATHHEGKASARLIRSRLARGSP